MSTAADAAAQIPSHFGISGPILVKAGIAYKEKTSTWFQGMTADTAEEIKRKAIEHDSSAGKCIQRFSFKVHLYDFTVIHVHCTCTDVLTCCHLRVCACDTP